MSHLPENYGLEVETRISGPRGGRYGVACLWVVASCSVVGVYGTLHPLPW